MKEIKEKMIRELNVIGRRIVNQSGYTSTTSMTFKGKRYKFKIAVSYVNQRYHLRMYINRTSLLINVKCNSERDRKVLRHPKLKYMLTYAITTKYMLLAQAEDDVHVEREMIRLLTKNFPKLNKFKLKNFRGKVSVE